MKHHTRYNIEEQYQKGKQV